MKLPMNIYLLAFFGLMSFHHSKAQPKLASNGINNSSIQITKEQSELIYNHVILLPNNTELSIAIIERGKTKFIGIKRVNDTIKLIKNYQSIFEIGSISKVFTATLLSSLVLEKKIKLDDAIQDYIDFKISINDNITFIELANHTSGLPRLPPNLDFSVVDDNNPYKDYDSQKLTEYLSGKIKLNQKPGIKYEYSNLGYGILGFQLVALAKTTYEDLLKQKIFTKFGMLNSTTQRNKVNHEIVSGLKPDGNLAMNWDFNALSGCGAILSSTEDLSKFALAQFDKKNKELVLTQEPTFKVNEKISLGLGWHILHNKNQNELVWHNGGTGGYSSSMALDIKNKKGIIILSNVSAFSEKMEKIDQLCFGLVKTLNGK
tara:strand:- start:30471 stop:31592 length:1122 start_codon:yes stop_codon:yes gene_type:complete